MAMIMSAQREYELNSNTIDMYLIGMQIAKTLTMSKSRSVLVCNEVACLSLSVHKQMELKLWKEGNKPQRKEEIQLQGIML